MSVSAFKWRSRQLFVLDQRLLPNRVKYISCRTPQDVVRVIRQMAVRGAPAIGCVAAYGLVLALKPSLAEPFPALKKSAARLKASRPTAVNLSWAIERMLGRVRTAEGLNAPKLFQMLSKEAQAIEREDRRNNRSMGRYGASLLNKNSVVMTHCNAGALATAGVGTALGIVREAHRRGRLKKVYVNETRPYLQGARLTAWELMRDKIPYELITDNMAAHIMKTERVDAVIVGCDRVAANGDTANKIGTYSLAILARHHRIPFYIAMPSATFDAMTPTGDNIKIEERSSDEVTFVQGKKIAPANAQARHPAFDVTPHGLITAFVTEFGIVRPPFAQNLKHGLL